MLTYITRRVLYSIPVLLVSSFLSFTFVSLAGDPTANLRQNPKVSQLTLHLLQHQYHLDQSVPVRYWYWLKDVFEHKLGNSLITSQPIWPDITRTHRPHRAGRPARRGARAPPGSRGRHLLRGSPVLGLRLHLHVGELPRFRDADVLARAAPADPVRRHLPEVERADLLHVGAEQRTGNATWSLDRLQHIALPVITLTIISFALYSRYMRASMLDVINTDYVRTARAKGLSEWRVIMRHVFRNALIPITTVVGAELRRRPRRRDRHRDRLQPRRDRLLLREQAPARGRVRRHGVSDGHRRDHHRLQPDRRHPVRLPRPEDSV